MSGLSWEYLLGTGYRVEASDLLPYESEQDDGSILRTDAFVNHRDRVITCSKACLRQLEKLK